MPLSDAQRSMRGQVAAYASHAKHDPRVRTRRANAASPGNVAYWEVRVRADQPSLADELAADNPQLTPEKLTALVATEVARRAGMLHQAHMKKLSLASSMARQARKSRR